MELTMEQTMERLQRHKQEYAKPTEQQLCNMIVDLLDLDASAVFPEADPRDLGADSLDLVKFFIALSRIYPVQVRDEECYEIRTICQIADYLDQKSNGNGH
jgi:acyl carrier protein